MITPILLAAALSCPAPKIYNRTAEQWGTRSDLRVIRRCTYVCGSFPVNNCLKWLLKKYTFDEVSKERWIHYHCQCGPKRKRFKGR